MKPKKKFSKKISDKCNKTDCYMLWAFITRHFFFYIWSFLPEGMITGQILTLNFYLILENRLVKPLTKLYMRYSFRLLSRIAWNIQLSWVWDVSATGVGCFSNWRCIQFKVIDSKQLRNTMKWFTKNKKDINYQRTIKYFTAFKQHVHVL